MCKLLWTLLPLFGSFCIHSQEYAVNNIDKALLKNANAVVRQYDLLVTFSSAHKLSVKTDYAITILNNKADDFLAFYAHYNEGDEKIKDLDIQIYDASGRSIKKVSKSEIEDIAYNYSSMITESRYKTYTHTPIDYPCTIEVSYSLNSKNTMALPVWNPILDYNVAVESSSYRIVNDTQTKINRKEFNLSEYENISISDSEAIAVNIPVVKNEKYSGGWLDNFPVVYWQPERFNYFGYVGSAVSWEEFGRWNFDTFIKKNKFSKPEKVMSEVGPALAGAVSKQDSIKQIYDFVQENTRYISIQLDEGGYAPMSLDKVHDNKYGDCKALSNYTRAILGLYNITSDYIIVKANTEEKASLYDDFTCGGMANHIILRVPMQREEEDIWLECTSHDSPFNFLGNFTDDRYVLAINESESKIIKTPSYAKLNSTQIISSVDLTDKEAVVSSEIRYTGLPYSEKMSISKLTSKKRDEILYEELFDFTPVRNLSKYSCSFDEKNIEATEKVSFTLTKYAEHLGSYLTVPVEFFDLDVPYLSTKKQRTKDIFFVRSYSNSIETRYTIPEKYLLDIDELDKEINSNFCHYSRKIKLENNILTVTRSFQLIEGQYNSESYKEMAKTLKSIRKAERESITLNNRT